MQGEQNWSRQRWSRIVPGEHFEHFQIKSTNSYIFCALVPLDGQLRLSGCPKLESHLWRFHPLQPNHHHFWRLSGLHQRRHDHQGCRNQASNIRVGDVNFKDEYEKTDVHVKVYFADGFKKHDSNIALIATNETIELNDETVMPIGLPEEDFRIERRAADQNPNQSFVRSLNETFFCEFQTLCCSGLGWSALDTSMIKMNRNIFAVVP